MKSAEITRLKSRITLSKLAVCIRPELSFAFSRRFKVSTESELCPEGLSRLSRTFVGARKPSYEQQYGWFGVRFCVNLIAGLCWTYIRGCVWSWRHARIGWSVFICQTSLHKQWIVLRRRKGFMLCGVESFLRSDEGVMFSLGFEYHSILNGNHQYSSSHS